VGYAYSFHVEVRTPAGWTTDPRVPSERGYFADIPSRSCRNELFWGRCSAFAMRPGPPPDRSAGSGLFRWLDGFYDYFRDEYRLHWIPASDLLIDLWDEATISLATNVPARFAHLFGDGQQSFPRAQLEDAGFDRDRLILLLDWRYHAWIAREPIDVVHDWRRQQQARANPDYLMNVTWKETITSLLGEQLANSFKGLAALGAWQDLRIITLYS
jgi:hypothetical protein